MLLVRHIVVHYSNFQLLSVLNWTPPPPAIQGSFSAFNIEMNLLVTQC